MKYNEKTLAKIRKIIAQSIYDEEVTLETFAVRPPFFLYEEHAQEIIDLLKKEGFIIIDDTALQFLKTYYPHEFKYVMKYEERAQEIIDLLKKEGFIIIKEEKNNENTSNKNE